MIINEAARTVTLEPTNCRSCHYAAKPGMQYAQDKCTKCGGTGNGPRGGAGGCKTCHGWKTVTNTEKFVPCSTCKGDYEGASMESSCDHPDDATMARLIELIPVTKVMRNHERQTFNEQHIGLGCIYTSVDYGDAWAASDDDVRAKVTETLLRDRTQLIKLEVRSMSEGNTVKLADEINVIVKPTGYSVVAVVYLDGVPIICRW